MPHVIAHIPRRFTSSSWGGTEQVIVATAQAESAAGFAPRVLTTTALDAQPAGVVAGLAIERHPYGYGELGLSAQRREHYDRKGGNLHCPGLERRLRTRPGLAVVHCHTGNRLGAQALAAAHARGVPCVITLHGGHFAIPAAERADLGGRDHGHGGLPWGRLLSWWYGTRSLLRRVDAVICVGHDEFVAARQALPGQRVIHLPGGIDPSASLGADPAAGRALLGLDGSRPLIACIARLDRQKDQATLVAAWLRCATPCDLALVGPETCQGYADELRRLAAAGPAPGRLLLPGQLPVGAIPHVLAAATFSALPSRHEPFGLAVIESWAVGRAVVAAATGGPAELLAGGGGLLFAPGDAAACAAAITTLLADRNRLQAYAAQGQARALGEFTWAQRSRRLLALYGELLAQSPGRAA